MLDYSWDHSYHVLLAACMRNSPGLIADLASVAVTNTRSVIGSIYMRGKVSCVMRSVLFCGGDK